jgi:hypothetical protein
LWRYATFAFHSFNARDPVAQMQFASGMNGKLASGLQNRLPELILQCLVSHTLPPLSEMSSKSQVFEGNGSND